MEKQKTAGETAKVPRWQGELCNKEFSAMLGEFEALVSLGGDKGYPKVPALIEKAKNSVVMTYRQVDAIVARCKYFLAGEYGNTKTAYNLSHSGLLLAKKEEKK